MRANMRGAAFVRYSGAMGAGHVGWSFDFDAENVNSGAVENPGGTASCDPDAMGYWDVFAYDPVPEMSERLYDAVKFVDIVDGKPSDAYKTVLWVAQQPYSVIGRNCLDDVYDVLRAFGVANMPPPSHDWLPNEWFGLWDTTYATLPTFTWRSAANASLAFLPAKDIIVPQLLAEVPAWRVPSTPEWHDLQSQLAEASGTATTRQYVPAPSVHTP